MATHRSSITILASILPLGLLPALIGCHGAAAAAGSADPGKASASPLPLAGGPGGRHLPDGIGRAQDARPDPLLQWQGQKGIAAHVDVPRALLARAIEGLFTDPAVGETRAVLVMHNGRIIGERYEPGYDGATRMLGWSMAKSVTGVLMGLLVADGRLRLDQPAPVPLWQRPGDPRGEITLRHLLQMRSGLRHREEADPVSDADTVRMLFLDGRDDMAAYAEAQPLAAVPGRQWRYSTATSVILADIAARTLTDSRNADQRRLAVSDYLRTRLFEPLGMRSATPEFDAAGTMIGGSMITATARDWGKFGEFLRNGGVVRGTRVLPHGWVQFMTTPAPGNRGYGAQLWLNTAQPGGHEELFPGRAPANLFACIGHLGQYVLVSPAQHLTVVRLGKTDNADRPALRARLGQLVALFPNGAILPGSVTP